MYQLALSHTDRYHPHDAAALDAVGVHSAERTLRELEKRGLVICRDRMWAFTAAGLDEARRVAHGEAAQ
jgi:hypothetical protein